MDPERTRAILHDIRNGLAQAHNELLLAQTSIPPNLFQAMMQHLDYTLAKSLELGEALSQDRSEAEWISLPTLVGILTTTAAQTPGFIVSHSKLGNSQVCVNEADLRLVIEELTRNSVKYGATSGTIHVVDRDVGLLKIYIPKRNRCIPGVGSRASMTTEEGWIRRSTIGWGSVREVRGRKS